MEALASWSAALTFDAPIWFRELQLSEVKGGGRKAAPQVTLMQLLSSAAPGRGYDAG